MLGIGVGGTAEKAMLMAKEALMEPIDMAELKARGPKSKLEELRVELYDRVNALGIGAQGLGGLSTVLDVKIRTYPAHAAKRPVAMIPNCAATRHAHFVLDGSGPAEFEAPSLNDWPKVTWVADASSTRVNLDTLRKNEIAGCLRDKCGPASTRPTRESSTCSRKAKSCPSQSPTGSSTTSARWTRCARRSSDLRAPPRLRAWTNSPT
jgi:hypothetical protein